MIIQCINCNKKFSVNSELIPSKGRTIQCGSCNHIWFFNKYEQDEVFKSDNDQDKKEIESLLDIEKKTSQKVSEKITEKNEKKVSKNQLKSNFTFGKFLSYILVFIISFIAFVVILDTFKTPLYKIFPNIEIFLFNLFETLKDIELFIKDLI
tara:strand:+ start:92 stop:547 length:456 start_codon:yes stop_codon:yes gene_type:complete